MVTKVKGSFSAPPLHFASLFRGFYGRVARKLDLDPSYVSRVARGERQSETIEAALEREMSRILALVGTNHNGANHNGAKKKQTAKKKSKKVLQSQAAFHPARG
jgi:hypothetical protein